MANGGAGRAIIGVTLTGGDDATLTGGDRAKLTGGDRAFLSAIWYDGETYQRAFGVIGQNGLLPDVPYRLNNKGEWVSAKKSSPAY